MPAVRGEGRRGALGQGQESSELANAMVSGPVGEALELGRDGKGFFRTNWRNVFESVEAMVRWGLKRRDIERD